MAAPTPAVDNPVVRTLTTVTIAALLAGLLMLIGGLASQISVVGALAAILGGLLMPRRQNAAATIAAVLLCAAMLALAHALLFDRFNVNYVWLYSATALPWYYKLANLWGGDEGTLLGLGAFSAVAAVALTNYGTWTGRGALLVTALFASGAVWWSPFTATPEAYLAAADGRGMNAHLVRFWMLLHPPMVFVAYTFFVAPMGAAFEALARDGTAWAAVAARHMRWGWLILSAGLAAGMWWAYEDFTFGAFWHWDVVQTSVFVVWALASAQLHTIRRYRANGAYARLSPLLGIATALAALLSLVITRTPTLASSHRYVGETSFPWILVGAIVVAAAIPWALWRARGRNVEAPRRNEAAVMITIAVLALTVMATVAAGYIAQAYIAEWQDWPRPASLKPFFAFLARWVSSREAESLDQLFAQWDVDRFGVNAWLAVIGIVVGWAGGHNFLPLRHWQSRWGVTAAVICATAFVPYFIAPTGIFYTGKGMTSANTTAIFPWLDGLAVAMGYFAVAALVWAIDGMRRRGRHSVVTRYYLPIGVIHAGLVVALFSATVATVYDVHTKRDVRFPEGFGQSIDFPWGYAITVDIEREQIARDGRRGSGDQAGGFSALGRVAWQRRRGDDVVQSAVGQAAYRDSQPPAPGGLGPVRLMCEILDYRYARTISGASQIIDPFIHRGWWRDVQVWLPAISYTAVGAEAPTAQAAGASPDLVRAPSTVPVVLRIYPMMTWLWIGLVVVLVAALVTMTHGARAVGRH